ncbi:MAG TPA: type II secretion system F family protein [Polyangiaceae bacterium]|nr:type II secretion system F family protein [Polyangiaceae bacterium]
MSPLLVCLRVSLPVVAFAAVCVGLSALIRVPSREAPRLGVRGLRRVQSVRDNGAWAEVEPAVRWLGARLRPLLGDKLRTALDRQITLAGDFCGLLPEELVALTALLTSVLMTLGASYGILSGKGPALYVLLGAALGVLLPYLHMTSIEQARKKHVQKRLPYVIDLLSLALSAGLDFPGALRQVVEKTSNARDPLVEEVNLILYELSVGKTRKQALAQLHERVPSESVQEFVAAVTQAEERGNPLAEVLNIQAEASRQGRSVRAEESASKAGMKMFIPIVIIVLVVMLMILAPLIMGLESSLGAE